MFSIYGSVWKVIENQSSIKCGDCPNQKRFQHSGKRTETAANGNGRTARLVTARYGDQTP